MTIMPTNVTLILFI
jgi:hypothetical protein